MPGHEIQEVTLDRRAIARFREDDCPDLPAFAVSLIDLFIEEARAQVDAIHQAEQRRDLRALKEMAHSLKGSSLTMGAKRLAALCARVEASADDQHAVIAGLMPEFDREFVKVRSALVAEREGAVYP